MSLVPCGAVLAIFLLDRLTKFWIQKSMAYGESLNVLPFFHITYIENTGAAFGMGQNQNALFVFASILILAALFIYARGLGEGNAKIKIALALIVGGALGNLYDRIVYGSVVDFLDFFLGLHHWPAFNVADSSICVGAILFAIFRGKTTPK